MSFFGLDDQISHQPLDIMMVIPALTVQEVEMRVNAMLGTYRVSWSMIVNHWESVGNSIQISPLPVTVIIHLSATFIILGEIGVNKMNFVWSGQKWEVMPESTIAPCFSGGMLSTFAWAVRHDVRNE